MTINTKTVEKIAKLSRIRLSVEEQEKYAGELGAIFDWVEQLQEVDTKDVPPMAGVGEYSLRMREDVVTGGNRKEEVLANAPETAFDCYVVPKVVE